MKAELPLKVPVTDLDLILRSAVVLNWEALVCQSQAGSVRVEYHIGGDGAIEFLKLWACGPAYWSLICDYSPRLSWSDGPRFSNGYHSRSLGRLLQSIMMNQNLFRHECRPNSNATLDVGTPTAEATVVATQWVTEAFPRAS